MITLADLRARDALPVWQEAVAIVQALLDTTMAERRSASRLPDVTHIGLEEDGAVVLLPQGSIPEHPVRHLAAVLGVLIESIPAPPPLLDFVNRNLADPPEHATAEDFSRALKYFERPERIEDIRHVVERALDAPVHTDVEAAQRQLEARVQELVAPLADGLPLVLETTPAADDAPALAADDARVRSDAALAATDEPPADLPAMEPAAAVVRTWPSDEARREVQRAFDSELFRGLVPLTILAIVIGAGYVARDRKVDNSPGAVKRVAAGALQAVDGAAAVAASNSCPVARTCGCVGACARSGEHARAVATLPARHARFRARTAPRIARQHPAAGEHGWDAARCEWHCAVIAGWKAIGPGCSGSERGTSNRWWHVGFEFGAGGHFRRGRAVFRR